MLAVLRDPRNVLPHIFAQRHPGSALLLKFVLPWAALRSIAFLARGLITKTVAVSVVLATGSWLLQCGTWLCLSLALPAVARTLKYHLSERHAMGLAAVTCAPLWLAGPLVVVPDEPPVWSYLSRLAVGLAASYGMILLARALTLLPMPRAALRPFVLASASAFALIYTVLFVLVGVAANVVLFWCGLGA